MAQKPLYEDLEKKIEELQRELATRKPADDALRESEEKYRTLFEMESDALALVDIETGDILEVNKALVDLYGYDRTEICHMKNTDFSAEPEKTRSATADRLERIPVRYHKKKDGTIFPTEITGNIFKYRGRDVHIAAMRDISERRRVEEELIRAKEQAEIAARAKSSFLANMSHELRTPLNAILGFAQIMERSGHLTLDNRKSLNVIKSSGKHLLNMINAVLDLSKHEAGRITLLETDFDLHRLVSDIREMFRLQAEDKGLQLVVKCSSHLPRFIHADEEKLREVIINLLGNSIKFTNRGQVTLRVETKDLSGTPPATVAHSRLQQPFSNVVIGFTVADTGSGIAPSETRRIFHAFEQGAAGEQANEGTGLGLSISQQHVRMMGGNIYVTSDVGRGSVFEFQIQVRLGDAIEFEPVRPLRQVAGKQLDEARHRILSVNDNEDDSQSAAPISLAPSLDPRLGFAELPRDLPKKLEEAAVRADMAEIDLLIAELHRHDERLARQLRMWADDFKYSEIIRLFRDSKYV